MVCIVASQKGGPGFESNSHLMPCGSPCSCSLYMGTLQVLELPPAVQRYASYINQDGQHDFELDKERKKKRVCMECTSQDDSKQVFKTSFPHYVS